MWVAANEAIVRVNSQSGKGGITYLFESAKGLAHSRQVQIEFSQVVQAVALNTVAESWVPNELTALFESRNYLQPQMPWRMEDHRLYEEGAAPH